MVFMVHEATISAWLVAQGQTFMLRVPGFISVVTFKKSGVLAF
jgi:hypothetical protein